MKEIRGVIKPETVERMRKYAPVKLGQSVDSFINDVLNNVEARKNE